MSGTSKHQSLQGKETLASHLARQSSPSLPPLFPAVQPSDQDHLGQSQKVPRFKKFLPRGQRVIGAPSLGQKGLVSVQFWTPCWVPAGLPFLVTSWS